MTKIPTISSQFINPPRLYHCHSNSHTNGRVPAFERLGRLGGEPEAGRASGPEPPQAVLAFAKEDWGCSSPGTCGLMKAFSLQGRLKHFRVRIMTTLKSLTIIGTLLVAGTSLAIAQNAPATGGQPPAAGGAANPATPGPSTKSTHKHKSAKTAPAPTNTKQ